MESELYEVYVKTVNGKFNHCDDIRSAIKQFLDEDGYRLIINIDGVVISLKQDSNPTIKSLDEYAIFALSDPKNLYCTGVIINATDSNTGK